MSLLNNQLMADSVAGIYQDLEELLMRNIVRHIRDYGKPIDSDDWQLQKLAELGALNKENIRIIAQQAGISQTAVERMLNEAAQESIKQLEPCLQNAAKDGLLHTAVDVDKSKNIKRTVEALQTQAKDSLNLCNTNMLYKARDAYKNLVQNICSASKEIEQKQDFIDLINKNVSNTVIGAESRTRAVRSCIKQFNEKGIPAFVDKAGREWTPEAYVNMCMRNTVKNVADEVQSERCKEYGCNLIEISSHSGARPKCAKDQSKIFDLNNGGGYTEDARGKKIRYYPWNSSSYGEPDGILGINCRHHKYPFVPGVNIKTYFPIDEEENDRLYEQTQVQRALERDVRRQKRECMLYDELGDTEAFEKAAVKLKSKEAKLKNYVDSNDNLHRRKDREQVVGFDKYISSKAVSANKNAYKKFVESVGEKDAPSFTKYTEMWYNNTKEFKELKQLAKYRETVPNAELKHYRLNETLHKEKLIKGNVVPIENKHAYILDDISYKKDPAHIMKRMNERNITSDQVQSYVDDAVFCVSQFKGTRLVYYSDEGVTVLTKTNDYDDTEWIAKTVWSKYDFDETTDKIMREARNYV